MKKKLVFGLIFLLVAFGALEAQYHFFLKANRYWSNTGIFSTDGRVQSIGENNGLRLGYTPSRYIDMACNDDGELEFEVEITRAGEGFSTMQFWTGWANVDENRKGVINIFASRDNVLTAQAGDGLPGSGGSPDMGMQIYVRNNEAQPDNYHLRGIESIASNKDSGAEMGEIIAAYFSAESRSGTESVAIKTVQVNYDQSGNVNTSHTGLYVLCNSQSNVGTNYGIQITTAAWNQTREYGLFIDSNGGSWTNAISFNGTITSALDFEGTDGTSAAYYEAGMTENGSTAADLDGWIRVTIDGNVLYIYCYADEPT